MFLILSNAMDKNKIEYPEQFVIVQHSVNH